MIDVSVLSGLRCADIGQRWHTDWGHVLGREGLVAVLVLLTLALFVGLRVGLLLDACCEAGQRVCDHLMVTRMWNELHLEDHLAGRGQRRPCRLNVSGGLWGKWHTFQALALESTDLVRSV